MHSSGGFACGSRPVIGCSRCGKGPLLEKAGDERTTNMATTVGTGTKRTEPSTYRKEWTAVKSQYERVRKLHVRKHSAGAAKRGERMKAEAVGLFLDYPKSGIPDETGKLPADLAKESRLQSR